MARKFYLFDTSAAKYYYLPAPKPDMQQSLAFLLAQRLQGNPNEAFFYIPVFCIAELFNLLACGHIRDKSVTATDYAQYTKDVAKHVRNGATFYPVNITRYHNYGLDEIYPVEHTTDTQYQAAGIPAPASKSAVDTALRRARRPNRGYHLSTFDLLIIAMGRDLQSVHGQHAVAILTDDQRLAKIANACPPQLGVPRAFYMRNTTLADIQQFHNA